MRNLPIRDDATLSPLGIEKNTSLGLKSSSKAQFAAITSEKSPPMKPASTKDLGVFDVPSSDDEEQASLPRLKATTQTSKRRPNEAISERRRQTSPDNATSTESSDGSRKRKRSSPSKHLQGGLETLAYRGPSKSKASTSSDLPSRKGAASAARQRGKATPLQNKPAENKRKNAKTINKPRIKENTRSTLISSSSAPATLERLLVNTATTALPVKDSVTSGPTPLTKRQSPPIYDEMELDFAPSTPPSAPPDCSATPLKLLNTPRHRGLWENLLKNDEHGQDENGMPQKSPVTSAGSAIVQVSKIRSSPPSGPQSTTHPKPTPPPRRTKLVHSLIGGPPTIDTTSEEDEGSSDDQSETEDIIMEEAPRSQGNVDGENDKVVDTGVPARRKGVIQTSGPKITYGEKRSFLSAPQADIDQILDAPLDDFGFGIQGPSSIIQPQSSIVRDRNDTGDEEIQEEEGPSMRSTHELRALGSNRRFVDKLDALLDDVNESHGTSKSAQRSALLELGEKMREKDFLVRLVQLDYDQKLFLRFTGQFDPISDFVWTAMVAIIIQGGTAAHVLQRMCRANIASSLIAQLSATNDIRAIAKERKTNMSKVAREDLTKFRDSLCQESIWGSQIPRNLSPRLIALKSLDLLIRKSRESGNMEAILDGEHVERLVAICHDAMEAGAVDQSLSRVTEAELALSALESDSIHLAGTTGENNWSSKALHRFADSTIALSRLFEANGGINESLLLRLCLNLTNNNPKVCEIIGNPEIVTSLARSVTSRFGEPLDTLSEELRASVLDRLILCLGTLINLAEFSETARLSLVADGDASIQGLLEAFAVGLKRSMEVSLAIYDLVYLDLTNE